MDVTRFGRTKGGGYTRAGWEREWSVPVRFLPEFAYFSRWFNFYDPQNRTPLFCLYTTNSVGLARSIAIRYKYTKDVIGHRRSLCGLASQGSHYPYPQTLSWEQPFLVGPSSTNYTRPSIAPTAKEFNRPHGKKMGT